MTRRALATALLTATATLTNPLPLLALLAAWACARLIIAATQPAQPAHPTRG
jgi:hypothetical protein